MDIRRTAHERKIGRNHLAFFRAYLQGLDAREMWERYLFQFGLADVRTIRATVHWLRLEFMAAARQAGEPKLAVLLKRDPNLMPAGEAVSLDEFAARYPPGFYNEAELDALYREEFGQGGTGVKRRARLRERQLKALHWVEQHLVSQPRPTDRCDAWLDEALARRLLLSRILTIEHLVCFINDHGYRWWIHVERLGEKGAQRVTRWLEENAVELGLALAAHATIPRRTLVVTDLADALPKSTAIVPMERLLIPADLNGANGRYRADPALCMLDASNDYEAIQAWLNTKRDTNATRRNYRKEVERFLLWAIVQKGRALSSMTVEDCIEYREFLRDPQPHERWCGPRSRERWTQRWRPFAGPLSPRSQHQAVVILKSLFEWMMRGRYLIGNAWDNVPALQMNEVGVNADRSFTKRQWAQVVAFTKDLPADPAGLRAKFVLYLAYETGLRQFELANARCGHLRRVTVDDEDMEAWVLDVCGKRNKMREVPMPDTTMRAMSDYLESRGLSRNPSECPPETALIARVITGTHASTLNEADTRVSTGTIYLLLKDIFKRVGAANTENAARFERASTHWLRHTFGSHAVADKAPLDVVQYILGHNSLETTSIYVTAERSRRIKEMRRLSAEREYSIVSPK